MIGILTWDIRAAGITLGAISGQINIDEMNVPAITASVLVPYDATVEAALDPRQTPVPTAVLTGHFTQWASGPISDITAYLAANGVTTLAGISALWAGDTLADASALFGAPLEAGASVSDETMELNLHVREIDSSDFDMRISFASDEALLTDWAPTDGLDFAAIGNAQEGIPDQQARKWIDPILELVLGQRMDINAYTLTALSSTYTDVINRELDMSAWEMIRQPLDDANLKLRVNRNGKGFSPQLPNNEIPGKTWSGLFTSEDVTSARRVLSRNDEWYDSASLLSWTTAGVRIYKGGPTGVHSRTYRERRAEGTPITSAQLVNINRRNINRGQFIDIIAPIRLGVFMMDLFDYQPDVGPLQPWQVQSVSYDIESGTMNVRGVRRY